MEAVDLQRLPRRSVLVKPLQLFQGFDAPELLEAGLTREACVELIGSMEEHSRLVSDVRIQWTSEDEDPGTREQLRLYLELFRHLYGGLRGASADFMEREIQRTFPDLADSFKAARAGAIEGIRQARALLAFLLGDPENDDQVFGIELIPRPMEPSAPSPSIRHDF